MKGTKLNELDYPRYGDGRLCGMARRGGTGRYLGRAKSESLKSVWSA